MLIAYWILAGLLALAYLAAGGLKLVSSKAQLEERGMRWVRGLPPVAIKLVALIEIVGVVGLIVPPLLGVMPALAVFAAIGFVVLQGVAIGMHMSTQDVRSLPINIILLALALATAWVAATLFVVG